jgi:hypothetical protein
VGQWRSKTTGKTNYNEAKAFKREFLESLKGQYNPTNDRVKFTVRRMAWLRIGVYRLRELAAAWRSYDASVAALMDFDVPPVTPSGVRKLEKRLFPEFLYFFKLRPIRGTARSNVA